MLKKDGLGLKQGQRTEMRIRGKANLSHRRQLEGLVSLSKIHQCVRLDQIHSGGKYWGGRRTIKAKKNGWLKNEWARSSQE